MVPYPNPEHVQVMLAKADERGMSEAPVAPRQGVHQITALMRMVHDLAEAKKIPDEK